MRRRSGFTIIELMLVVGIIGVLATIAIPTMLGFKLRSKLAEGKTNLSGIHKAQETYFAEYGAYVSADPTPVGDPDSQHRSWGLTPTAIHGFNRIGFSPEGQVYFQYAATTDGGSAVTLSARSDLDGNGDFNTWGYVKPTKGTASGVVGAFGVCPATGVLDPISRTPNQLREYGPCDVTSGASNY
jgi:type IV pilus assembly protein PilA